MFWWSNIISGGLGPPSVVNATMTGIFECGSLVKKFKHFQGF